MQKKCNYDEKISHLIINANLTTENLNFILDILKSSYDENEHANCRRNVTKTIIAGEHLIIEPILPMNMKTLNYNDSVKLIEIPSVLGTFDKIYLKIQIFTTGKPIIKIAFIPGTTIYYTWKI